MSELDLRWGDPQGYWFDRGLLIHDLYLLAAIFAGSEKISQAFRVEKDTGEEELEHSIFSQFRKAEFSEAQKLLLSIASISRNFLDVYKNIRKPNIFVGELNNYEKLTFRDACNKIIHADDINFDTSDNLDILSGHLNPIVYLYGKEQNGIEWKATVSIFEFIGSAYEFVSRI